VHLYHDDQHRMAHSNCRASDARAEEHTSREPGRGRTETSATGVPGHQAGSFLRAPAGEARALLTNISKIRIIILLDMPVLKPSDFHILLALAGGPLHGYRIMKDVERDTGGEVTLEIGSLYRLLARLVTEGLMDDVEGADDRRRYLPHHCPPAEGR